MKKTLSVLVCLLFALTVLYPAGKITADCFGYSFKLISTSAFAIVIAVLSACICVVSLICRNDGESKLTAVLLAVITPLSLINAVFYIGSHPQIGVISGTALSVCCCCFLTIKYGKPLPLKKISLVLSVIMIGPICFLCFLALTFGNFGQNTVVKTVESPSGEYYAQVIDDDHGALGGNTLVVVCEKSKIDAILFKIEKKHKRVYVGDWGEFKNMHICWKDDHCLVINSVEYEME